MEAKTIVTSEQFELRITEVLESMNAGFSRMDRKFSEIDKRFGGIDARLDSHDKQFINLIEGQNNLLLITQNIQYRVGNLEVSMEEIKEDLGVLTEAEEKDAMASINHEFRIIRLEKRNDVAPESLPHLAIND
jgi:hypothetical protein